MHEIVKCMKCGHVLISGANMFALFSKGTSIKCLKCGNKHVFGQQDESCSKCKNELVACVCMNEDEND